MMEHISTHWILFKDILEKKDVLEKRGTDSNGHARFAQN